MGHDTLQQYFSLPISLSSFLLIFRCSLCIEQVESRFSSLGEGIFRDVYDLKNVQRGLHLLQNRRPQVRHFLVRCKRGTAASMASYGPFLAAVWGQG